VRGLDDDLRAAIAANGIRNALLTSIAPTGTISLFADNVSSGIEPVFSHAYTRKVLLPDGSRKSETVSDHAYRLYREKFGEDAPLTDAFVTAQELEPRHHIVMQAALQPHVDSSISKTINMRVAIAVEAFKQVYRLAYETRLKGCTTYRPNDVTGSVLAVEPESDTAQTAPAEAQASLPLAAPPMPSGVVDPGGDVVYMKQPLEREQVLPGFTYKLKWPDSDHAIYVTLNDIVQDGRRRPFEIFINSKNMEHYAWTVALTRMISAVFRRGGDVSFVVEELKAVFDPRGGQWMEGRYVPSLLAAIGGVIERHMIDTGFLAPSEAGAQIVELAETGSGGASDGALETQPDIALVGAHFCPKCNSPSLVFQEGCHTCMSCGYSKCS